MNYFWKFLFFIAISLFIYAQFSFQIFFEGQDKVPTVKTTEQVCHTI